MTNRELVRSGQSHHGKYSSFGDNRITHNPRFGGIDGNIASRYPCRGKSCKTIADDRERLRCFDGLFGSTPKPQASEEGKQGNWSIDETK